MEKIMVEQVLKKLDELYGMEKAPFPYREPWQLLVSIILSAQTTDQQVMGVLPDLFARYKTVGEMAAAERGTVMDLIRPVGLHKTKAENLIACCRGIEETFGGKAPEDLDSLLTLPGVGRKTATLFLADAFDIPGVTVDTHVFRISHRLGWAKGKTPAAVEKELERLLPKEHWNRVNFQLVEHGRRICRARKAGCGRCPLAPWCGKLL